MVLYQYAAGSLFENVMNEYMTSSTPLNPYQVLGLPPPSTLNATFFTGNASNAAGFSALQRIALQNLTRSTSLDGATSR